MHIPVVLRDFEFFKIFPVFVDVGSALWCMEVLQINTDPFCVCVLYCGDNLRNLKISKTDLYIGKTIY